MLVDDAKKVCRGQRVNIIQHWNETVTSRSNKYTLRKLLELSSPQEVRFLRFTIDIPMPRNRDMRIVLRIWERYGNRRWTSTTGDCRIDFFKHTALREHDYGVFVSRCHISPLAVVRQLALIENCVTSEKNPVHILPTWLELTGIFFKYCSAIGRATECAHELISEREIGKRGCGRSSLLYTGRLWSRRVTVVIP